MTKLAYALREDYLPQSDSEGVEQNPDAFHGGSVTRPDGSFFDIGAALEEGEGMIVTDDSNLHAALGTYPALENVPVPPELLGLGPLSRKELEVLSDAHGLQPEKRTKEGFTEALSAAGIEAPQDGEQAVAPDDSGTTDSGDGEAATGDDNGDTGGDQ